MTEATELKRRVRQFNKVIVSLQRIGIAWGPTHLLTMPGRRTGLTRTAPINVVSIAGQRYIIQVYPSAAWVTNARSTETVTLSRGRRSSTVRLVEVPIPERRPLLHDHVLNSPKRVAELFVRSGLTARADVATVMAAADRIAIFRVIPA
ncbi:nitroreductase family deazaflavin-dependent oxidoreductase [Nocardia sp. NPDC059240]|uniref:nitroreductase family deazaflavin-dependent oxidoreductase n=1 Tax=Nocardia sp. NPDC059240 TaxID=3346786 RepID=UPI0036C4AD94